YVYLTRAFGRGTGYLFGWSQVAVVRPADIALLAFIFARYAKTLYAPFENGTRLYAVVAIVALTAVNILGVREGKWTQNLLTAVKVAGLLAIVALAVVAPAPAAGPSAPSAAPPGGLALALILVLFTFGGWNEIAYVAAEIREPKRNIVRALVLGAATITVLYLLVNGAFLHALGYESMIASEAVATDTAATVFPHAASRVVSVLICISALGAISGLVFTGSRITYAVGKDHALFHRVGRWNPRLGTPMSALLLQSLVSIAFVVAAGSFINTLLYTAPVVWFFFLATGLSVFVLRGREPGTPRPFRVPALLPVVFCASCIFMLYSCLTYAANQKMVSLYLLGGTLVTGVITFGISLLVGKMSRPKTRRASRDSLEGGGIALRVVQPENRLRETGNPYPSQFDPS
ncbi:MAG: APC family permease, partial [Planctomycetota bacterium]